MAIEITVNSMMDDSDDSPYRGRSSPTVILSSTVPLGRMQYSHLGFPIKWERFTFERDGKYITHCWLVPFLRVHITIPPFHLVLDNVGDGQVGIYLKAPCNTPRMILLQEGKQDREVEPYTFKKTRYAVAHVGELQTLRID